MNSIPMYFSYSLKSAIATMTILAIAFAALAPWLRTLSIQQVFLLGIYLSLGLLGGLGIYLLGTSLGRYFTETVQGRLMSPPVVYTAVLISIPLLLCVYPVINFSNSDLLDVEKLVDPTIPGVVRFAFESHGFRRMTFALAAMVSLGIVIAKIGFQVSIACEGVHLPMNRMLKCADLQCVQWQFSPSECPTLVITTKRKLLVFGNQLNIRVSSSRLDKAQLLLRDIGVVTPPQNPIR